MAPHNLMPLSSTLGQDCDFAFDFYQLPEFPSIPELPWLTVVSDWIPNLGGLLPCPVSFVSSIMEFPSLCLISCWRAGFMERCSVPYATLLPESRGSAPSHLLLSSFFPPYVPPLSLLVSVEMSLEVSLRKPPLTSCPEVGPVLCSPP